MTYDAWKTTDLSSFNDALEPTAAEQAADAAAELEATLEPEPAPAAPRVLVSLEPLTCDGACRLYQDERDCRAEARDFKATAKRGKPLSYTWRLWSDPKAGQSKPMPTGSLRPAWANGAPAYRAILAAERVSVDSMRRRDALYVAWLERRAAA